VADFVRPGLRTGTTRRFPGIEGVPTRSRRAWYRRWRRLMFDGTLTIERFDAILARAQRVP
jgi:hypothetical protein